MRRKLTFAGVLLASALALAGCGNAIDTGTGSTDKPAEGDASALPKACSDENPYLAVLLPNLTNPYYVAMKEGFETQGEKQGFKVEVQIANDDDANQLSQATAMLQKSPCAVALNPVKSEPAAAIVKAANDAGVPVFTVNVTVDDKALTAQGAHVIQYLGADNVAGGEQTAEQVLADMGADAELKIGFVTEPDEVPVVQRDGGFKDKISANPNAEVVAQVDGNVKLDDSLAKTSELLQGNPGLNVIFASTGPAAQGAIEAVKASGRDVKVYGFCAAELATDTKLYPACVAQEPKDYGMRVVDQVKAYIGGEKVETNILRPLKMFKAGETPGPGEVG
ncbi:MAG: substrate-binding domain-containing protein [Actinomycetaceae bacterium]|nr:substrate-binding domain-containing protein [Actinomycetaceae bacterium]